MGGGGSTNFHSGLIVDPMWKAPVIIGKAVDKRGIEDNSKRIFLISQQKHDGDPSLEQSRGDGL